MFSGCVHLFGWSTGLLVHWSAGSLISWLVGRTVGRTDEPVDWLPGLCLFVELSKSFEAMEMINCNVVFKCYLLFLCRSEKIFSSQ